MRSGKSGVHEALKTYRVYRQAPDKLALEFGPYAPLARRGEPEVRVSEKWIRFSAPNEAPAKKGASDGSKSANPLLGPML
jgi:hypothetical protein